MQLWQQVILAVIGGAITIFSGVGFWQYLTRRFDEGTKIRTEQSERIKSLEERQDKSDQEHTSKLERMGKSHDEKIEQIEKDRRENERKCEETVSGLKDQVAEMRLAFAEEKLQRRELEDLILHTIRFRPHDFSALQGVERFILDRRRNPNDAGSLASRTAPQHRKHIQVVDDQADTTKFLSAALNILGYEVHCADNGPDALQQFLSMRDTGQHFDLAMLDYTMPGMTGTDVALQMRSMEIPHTMPIKIMFLSGSADSIPEHELAQIGASAVLSKPVDLDQLRETLAGIFETDGVLVPC